ncbi:MAG: hypothetical protein SOZ59_03335 [Candidatus Limivivens sp.]|nr:hypothetical protein [Candidatus Limivivens sp.]
MISKRRVRLMTRLAICEKDKGLELKNSGNYFRSDYIGIHLMKNFLRMTAAFLLGLGLWVLLRMDYVVEKLGVLDVAGMGLDILVCYGILTACYLLLTYLVYTVRYYRAEKVREDYNQMLLSLEREYSRDGRRMNRAGKPEGDGR